MFIWDLHSTVLVWKQLSNCPEIFIHGIKLDVL
jgi:hypothetical protein